jgi:acyl-[acyl carrier protein]--UDP-N-acetylglucosamine O-acyltransferase
MFTTNGFRKRIFKIFGEIFMKIKRKNFTKAQIKKLKPYWKAMRGLEDAFFQGVQEIEKKMQENLKIDDVEFFCVDGNYCGIGNVSKTINLIQSYELEKE